MQTDGVQHDSGRRVAWAIGLSVAMLFIFAWLFPRNYLANDDIGLTEYLRRGTYTPWISPVLARGFRFAYEVAPGAPWWGLYQYALLAASGALLFYTCTELVDRRPGLGQTATLLGVAMLAASHAIGIIGITWTAASITALGTATAAFVSHVLTCRVTSTPLSRTRAVICGVLAVCGYMLRPQGLGAMVAALAPALGWAALHLARARYWPRPSAIALFVAPLAIVVATQGHVAGGRDDRPEFAEWTAARGAIHGLAAFQGLDKRAPELLARAGWTTVEYHDFVDWLIVDERDYPKDKLQRLADTGGVPEHLTVSWGIDQLRELWAESAASVALFLTMTIGGIALALVGVVDRKRGIAFCTGYLGFIAALVLWMAANYRFPQRVALSFFTVAAFGMFVFLARAIIDRPARSEASRRGGAIVLGIIALCMFVWARNLIAWIDRDPWPHQPELQAFEDRVAARGGFDFVYIQSGLVNLDPLRAEPRRYDGLEGGWGTFSTAWYDVVKRTLRVDRGAEVLPAMIDNENAYLIAPRATRDDLEKWLRRKTDQPALRLALVDGADFIDGSRPELYRLVTTRLERDSDEWRLTARDERAGAAQLPGPPDVSGLEFRPITLALAHGSVSTEVHSSSTRIEVEQIDRGIRASVIGNADDGCAVTSVRDDGGVGHSASIKVPAPGVYAVRFHLRLISPENIVAFDVYGRTRTSRSMRWGWQLTQQTQQVGYDGSFTLVAGHRDRYLWVVSNAAAPRDVRDLEVAIVVKPGTQAGFELQGLEVASP